MSEHRATVSWNLTTETFDYAEYNREHTWEFPSGRSIEASSAPEFLGSEDCVDPEEAFVASLSSCHMLTFLAICSKKRLKVISYRDSAVGVLEKNADGKLAITRVLLRPQIEFATDAPSPEQLTALHDSAHRNCFIANSVRTDVEIEPTA